MGRVLRNRGGGLLAVVVAAAAVGLSVALPSTEKLRLPDQVPDEAMNSLQTQNLAAAAALVSTKPAGDEKNAEGVGPGAGMKLADPSKNNVGEIPGVKDLLIAVVTAPGHYSARDAIRETVMVDADASGRADVHFFVGLLPENFPHREEADKMITAEKGMIRLDDFTENYHNLSSKALDIFDWGFRAGYRNVFKIDDDTFLNVGKALELVDQNYDKPFLYAGRFENGKKATVYDNRSKWYMQDQYPYELMDYAQGSGFLLGQYVLEYIHDNKDRMIRYRVDDAAVPIWLSELPLQTIHLNNCDHYATWTHDWAFWVSPLNPDEMRRYHGGQEFMPQICQQTCLCLQDDCTGPGWDTFMLKEYVDQIPRT